MACMKRQLWGKAQQLLMIGDPGAVTAPRERTDCFSA
ncbi:Uncharacterised protein [Mycobacterium tuberculosis]|nr:Uncharacterised protein [Mycobacterium tuberculosis]